MDTNTRLAIDNAACYLCDILNASSLAILYDTLLTPEQVVYRLLLAEKVPDGKQAEIVQTLRGVDQRAFNLKQAIHGEPGKIWMRRWSEVEQTA